MHSCKKPKGKKAKEDVNGGGGIFILLVALPTNVGTLLTVEIRDIFLIPSYAIFLVKSRRPSWNLNDIIYFGQKSIYFIDFRISEPFPSHIQNINFIC